LYHTNSELLTQFLNNSIFKDFPLGKSNPCGVTKIIFSGSLKIRFVLTKLKPFMNEVHKSRLRSNQAEISTSRKAKLKYLFHHSMFNSA
ncbi:MAG: hypothetical protein J6T41_04545, partial [Neisseriaceae bacterium]|nr:hypothetical protein [Neisseriaceae bacterium]